MTAECFEFRRARWAARIVETGIFLIGFACVASTAMSLAQM
jgi:hypothetical protein